MVRSQTEPRKERRRGPLRPLSLAPMMERTDRHFRFLLRTITHHTLNYTEMVTTGALIHGDRQRLLAFDPAERPLALQLGGDRAAELARCAAIAEAHGFDEVNLNVGCPSDRVQKGRFGACLMAEPASVRDAVAAMRDACALPVTVKHRIGIDHLDRFEDLLRFVDIVAEGGSDRFAVHARIAWLKGLSPKENREVPPLRHGDVYRLKRERPTLAIEINGGIRDLDQARQHLERVDGAMIGRAAWDDPYLFAAADRRFYDPAAEVPSRRQIVLSMLPYIEDQCTRGVPLRRIVPGMMHLFRGCPSARAWRRTLSEETRAPAAGPEIIERALARLPETVLDQRPAACEQAGDRRSDDRPSGDQRPEPVADFGSKALEPSLDVTESLGMRGQRLPGSDQVIRPI